MTRKNSVVINILLQRVSIRGYIEWKNFYTTSCYILLRRKRKLRFLISNFKYSTGLFELTLPSTKSKRKDYKTKIKWGWEDEVVLRLIDVFPTP